MPLLILARSLAGQHAQQVSRKLVPIHEEPAEATDFGSPVIACSWAALGLSGRMAATAGKDKGGGGSFLEQQTEFILISPAGQLGWKRRPMARATRSAG
jgi:uncharacterized membrane protein